MRALRTGAIGEGAQECEQGRLLGGGDLQVARLAARLDEEQGAEQEGAEQRARGAAHEVEEAIAARTAHPVAEQRYRLTNDTNPPSANQACRL